MAKQNWPQILYEDRELLVVNKPAGQLSVATEGPHQFTAYSQATDYIRIRNKKARLFIVHRLDRDTSGVLLFAKNETIKLALQETWNQLVTHRGYQAIVTGTPPKGEDTLRSYLLENKVHVVYSAPQEKGGRLAETAYRLVAQRKGYSLLDLTIQTGRKNQIRVQLADMGCPVAGDKKYGGAGVGNPVGRLGLHASRLTLNHPKNGREYSFTAPMPIEFQRLFPQKPMEESASRANEKKSQSSPPDGTL